MIKGMFGYFLSGAGLVAIITLVQNDSSTWYVILAGFIFFIGLELIVDGKISDVKKEIIDEINNNLKIK